MNCSRPCVTATLACAGALLSQNMLMAQAPPGAIKPHAGMLRFPAVSAKQIVFVYANKLWIVSREGGQAIPLASPPGHVSLPHFSPDGTTIAFTGNYDGNPDLYTLPTEGGIPFRVTHHPAVERLCNWTPDGKLLFAAEYGSGVARAPQLYVVAPTGGLPVRLPVPYGDDAAISPDGKTLAYTPSSVNYRTWKRYRGGWAQDIWLFDLQHKTSKKITDWEGTDTLPMWRGDTIYYLSDNGPEHRLNLWRYNIASRQRQQVTRYADYDIKWPSIGPGPTGKGEIVFQHGSELDLMDLSTGKAHAVDVHMSGDHLELRTRTVDASQFIQDWSISPSGKHAAIQARGDIWIAPAQEGVARNLTHSDGVAERSPAWSPDGRWVAYFSDKTGEYELCVTQSDGKGETRQLTHDGHMFRSNPQWSPDSKQIAFNDKSGVISLFNLASGQTKRVDTDPGGRSHNIAWSPDSRWLAYPKSDGKGLMTSIWIYSVEAAQTRQVTAGMFTDDAPVFDRKGDYLYFASGRSFNPQYDDIGMSWIYADTQVLLAVPLRADMSSPYLPKAEDEKFSAGAAPAAFQTEDARRIAIFSPYDSGQAVKSAAADEVTGDWSGQAASVSFSMHLVLGANGAITGTLTSSQGNGSLTGSYDPAKHGISITVTITGGPTITLVATISGGALTGMANVMGQSIPFTAQRAGGDGAQESKTPESAPAVRPAATTPVKIDFDGFEARAILLPVRNGQFGQLAVNDRGQLLFVRQPSPGAGADAGIRLFDINDEKKQEMSVAAGATNFDITPDGKKLLVVRGTAASVQDAAPGGSPESIITSGMTAQIDPRREWREIFDDAWRLERDFFYDPNMHGVNWKAIHDQYALMLDDCADREDVGYVIGEMISELNVGHAYYFGGDTRPDPSVSVGMLGADFEISNGAYRIAKIYSGAAWDVDARGPLRQPGVKVKEGDYLLAVNGTPLDTTRDPWEAFQGLGNKLASITVSDKPKMDASARDVAVRLVGSDDELRYRDWIEHNRAYVAAKTGGRVGYIYVPDTGVDGQNDLVRQFMGQTNRDALIIDERWNGGGQIPDRFIELLNRPVTNYYARRDGTDWTWPPVSHQGPKCMLINGESGSGGDAFPWLFRNAGLGKLIGMRTWGGLVGLTGYPSLIDGALVTAPSFAFYKKNGTWGIEGHGVDPDIEVVDDPALMQNGDDPQLDAGIKEMLEELKHNPYTPPRRPPYPNKSGMGIDPKDK